MTTQGPRDDNADDGNGQSSRVGSSTVLVSTPSTIGREVGSLHDEDSLDLSITPGTVAPPTAQSTAKSAASSARQATFWRARSRVYECRFFVN